MVLDATASNVAGAIEIGEKEKLRAVLKPGVVSKKKRIAIVKWLTGGVARHKTCTCGVEMSRVHAIECSGANELLFNRFGDEINQDSEVNWISQILNLYRKSTESRIYNVVYGAIKMIYENCLGYRQQANGFFAENREQAERDRNEAVRGFNRPIQVQRIPARRPRETQENHERRVRPRNEDGNVVQPAQLEGENFHAWRPP
jgi:hypothetical protein